MSQFVVPQFIDVEDKILGPLTVRQFVILLVVFGVDFLFYKLFDFALFLIVGLPIFIFGMILAFIKVNGQPFHFYLLNMAEFVRLPRLRIWDKRLSDAEVSEYLTETPPPPPSARVRKEAPAATRLNELALIVNTGGVYRPEEE